jgi:hypothetical protein
MQATAALPVVWTADCSACTRLPAENGGCRCVVTVTTMSPRLCAAAGAFGTCGAPPQFAHAQAAHCHSIPALGLGGAIFAGEARHLTHNRMRGKQACCGALSCMEGISVRMFHVVELLSEPPPPPSNPPHGKIGRVFAHRQVHGNVSSTGQCLLTMPLFLTGLACPCTNFGVYCASCLRAGHAYGHLHAQNISVWGLPIPHASLVVFIAIFL